MGEGTRGVGENHSGITQRNRKAESEIGSIFIK